MLSNKQYAQMILNGDDIEVADDHKIRELLAHYDWLQCTPNSRVARQRALIRLMGNLSESDRLVVGAWYRNGGDLAATGLPSQPVPPPEHSDSAVRFGGVQETLRRTFRRASELSSGSEESFDSQLDPNNPNSTISLTVSSASGTAQAQGGGVTAGVSTLAGHVPGIYTGASTPGGAGTYYGAGTFPGPGNFPGPGSFPGSGTFPGPSSFPVPGGFSGPGSHGGAGTFAGPGGYGGLGTYGGAGISGGVGISGGAGVVGGGSITGGSSLGAPASSGGGSSFGGGNSSCGGSTSDSGDSSRGGSSSGGGNSHEGEPTSGGEATSEDGPSSGGKDSVGDETA